MLKLCASILFSGALACAPTQLIHAADNPLDIRAKQRDVAKLLLETYIFIGGGSGVLAGPNGLIVTNDHVAGGQKTWEVRMADGRRFTAHMLGTDTVGDISVLQIENPPENLPWGKLATESDMKVGMPVLAVGNPFSLGNHDDTPTLTDGVLNTGRVVRGNYADCLQLDAPVNPGNSGGPLLSRDGKLLGINGQIRTRSGMRVNSGIGLAISAVQLADFMPRLAAAEGGYVHHCDVPDGLEFEQKNDGVYVSAIPEDMQSLSPGDKLLRIEGRLVTSVPTAIGCFQAPAHDAERLLTVIVERDGATESIAVKPGRLTIPGRPWHGLSVRILKDETITINGQEEELDVIAFLRKVDPGSPAEKAGITNGAYLLSINGKAIERSIDVVKAMVGQEVGDTIRAEVLTAAGTVETHDLYLVPRP